MPKCLADARIKLYALATEPKTPEALTVADLDGALRLDKGINKADYKLSATGNSTVAETELCNVGEGQAPGPAQYEGSITPFWYLDDRGQPAESEMEVWDAVKEFGTELFLVEVEGPKASVPAAAGDLYTYYKAVTQTPQAPSDRATGYIKRTVPLSVQDQRTGVLAAGK